MRVGELTEVHRSAWDSLVSAHPGSGFMQSWIWSEFKSCEGYQVLRLGLFEGETLIGGCLFYGYSTATEATLWAAPDGPLLDWTQAADVAWRLLVSGFRRSPLTKHAAVLRVEPRLSTIPGIFKELPRAPSDLVPDETLEITLGTDDAMLAAMKPKGRYNARLALRHGVTVEFSQDPADVDALYPVLEATGHFHDFRIEPRNFFLNLARLLLPSGTGEIVVARYRGMVLAAAFLVYHGRHVTYLYGGHLPLFANRMAPYALHWEVMRHAAAKGFQIYDLYGYVGPHQVTHPYFGFSRFKEKLGGTAVRRMGSRDLIFYDRLAKVAVEAIGREGILQ